MNRYLFRLTLATAFLSTFLNAASLTGYADPNPPGCKEALEAIKRAQTEHSLAVAAWRKAESRVRTQENKIDFLNRQLSSNDRALGKALLALDAVKADQAACEAFEKDPENNLAPLCDCSKVPDRLQAAQASVDELEMVNKDLNSELDVAEAELAALEDERAAAHAEERKAAAALEAAKAAAAAMGCHLHA